MIAGLEFSACKIGNGNPGAWRLGMRFQKNLTVLLDVVSLPEQPVRVFRPYSSAAVSQSRSSATISPRGPRNVRTAMPSPPARS